MSIIEAAHAGITNVGYQAGLPPLDWSIDQRPNWVEFIGITRTSTPDGQGADVARRWAEALGSIAVDPMLAGTVLYVRTQGPITVSITGVTNTTLYRQKVDTSLP